MWRGIRILGGSASGSISGSEGGGTHKRESGWTEVVERVKTRLRKWEDIMISMGGRFTLIKFVLSSLHIYTLSLIPLPKKY